MVKKQYKFEQSNYQITGNNLEMGKNPHCSGSVLFGFYNHQGSV